VTHTKAQVAQRLGITVRTLGRIMKRGEIGYYRITAIPTFSDQHIEEFLKSKEVRPTKVRRTA
jgi:predicted site-specific integrase-resolvase